MTSSRSLAVVCAGVATTGSHASALTSVGGTVADVPADNVALEYVGSFEGAPARSAVSVTLFATADAGSAFCGPVSAEVTGTRFKAALPPECAVGIRGSAPAFVQVAVAGINVERVRSGAFRMQSRLGARRLLPTPSPTRPCVASWTAC